MTSRTEDRITKIVAVTFASLLTVTGWLATSEITSMAQTLKEIRADVSNLNTRSLLQEQEFKWMKNSMGKLDKRISNLENRK